MDFYLLRHHPPHAKLITTTTTTKQDPCFFCDVGWPGVLGNMNKHVYWWRAPYFALSGSHNWSQKGALRLCPFMRTNNKNELHLVVSTVLLEESCKREAVLLAPCSPAHTLFLHVSAAWRHHCLDVLASLWLSSSLPAASSLSPPWISSYIALGLLGSRLTLFPSYSTDYSWVALSNPFLQ